MRNTFINGLYEAAKNDPEIMVIIGDLGFSAFEPFREQLPEQCINVGICEQNMIGIAAGLAMMQKKVFVYSIIPFLTMRCYEQIRNDICYQNLPVTLIGVGAGFAYGAHGGTHHALEDVNLMRGLSGMRVFSPADADEVHSIVNICLVTTTPVYVRIGKSLPGDYRSPNESIDVTKPVIRIPATQHRLLTTGSMLAVAYNVHRRLQKQGIMLGVYSVPCLKPIELTWLNEQECTSIFTLEDHSIIGGLGTAVSEYLAEQVAYKPLFQRFGIPDRFVHIAGTSDYLHTYLGCDARAIADTITRLLHV